MISIETMKFRNQDMVGDEFPLVYWDGTGRIVRADDSGLDLLVHGMRARYTWDRLKLTRERLLANHHLTVDELGGGHDAVGIVSLFAFMDPDDYDIVPEEGLLVLLERPDTPVHQYADMDRPTSWEPWRRKLYGDG